MNARTTPDWLARMPKWADDAYHNDPAFNASIRESAMRGDSEAEAAWAAARAMLAGKMAAQHDLLDHLMAAPGATLALPASDIDRAGTQGDQA